MLTGENEYTTRAQPWLLSLTAGMVRGYRVTAGRLSLQFAETFMRFQKGMDDPILLAFSFPSGSASPVPELTRASQGMPLQPAAPAG